MHRDLIMHGCARPTIFITGRADVATSVQAMKGGALDFLIKPVQEAELVTAVSKAIEHDRYAREEDARLHDVRTRIASLTPKQREVLVHIVAGRRNREIAAEMHISEKTVKIHRSQVLAKLNARSNVDLARLLYGRSLDEAETLSDVLLKIGNGLITL